MALTKEEESKARLLLANFNSDPEELKAKLEVFDDLNDMVAFFKREKQERERWAWARSTIYNSAKWLAGIGAVIAMMRAGVFGDFWGGEK